MTGGTITRKDLITDEGLEFGKEYAKNINVAIEANKELIESAKALNVIAAQYQKIGNTQQYTALKQQETLETTKAMNAIKLEVEAIKAAEKAKQESLRTRKLELDAMAKEEAAKKRNTKLTIEERVELEANNKALKQAAREKLGLVSVYDKLNAKRTEAKNRLRDLIATENASTESIKKAQAEFDKLDKKVQKADDAVRDFTKNVGNYPKLNAFAGGLKNLVGAFGLVGGVAAIASVVKGAVTIVREYEAEIVNLAAVAGKSRKEIKPLEDQIRSVAKTSINGATDIAKLASELIKLGSTEDEVIALLKPIDDLSVALRATAEDSASLVKGLLNAYGEGADQAARYTDVLAAAANKTSLDFNGLRDSLSYLAPVAKSLNLSLEETTSIIGILADNNIKAESAGRLMATSFTRLATNGMTLNQALDQVNKKQAEGADNLEVLALAGELFGAESAKLALILANNRDKMTGLNEEFKNSKGSLEELTNKQLQSLDARLKQVDSAWEDFVLSIEDGQGVIGAFVSDWLAGFAMLLDSLTELNDSWAELQEKAEQAGKADGLKRFQESIENYKNAGTTEAAALSLTLQQAQLELSKFQGELDKANSKLKEYEDQNFFAGVFGGGYDMEAFYNEEIVRLKAATAKQQAIIDSANKKMSKSNEEKLEAEKKITQLSEDEIKKRKDAAIKARQEQLSKSKQADDEEFALLKFRAERNISISDEIADNETESIETRIDAYLNAQQIEVSLAEQTAAYKLRAISQYSDEVRDLTNAEIQTLINGGQIKKQLSKDEVLVLEQLKAQKEDLDKKDLANRQKIVDSIVDVENKKIASLLKLKDTELNNKLIKENEYFSEELKALQGNQQAIEDATKDHEARVQKIKEDAVKQSLQTQIDAQRKLLENSQLSADVRADIENKLSKLELELNQIGVDSANKSNEEKLEAEKEYSEKIKDIAIQLKDAIIDLTNSLFDAKIQSIDNEIARNEEYYSRQIELAGDDQAQKDLLQLESEKKRKKLEDEKRKEQQKQAIFNKANQAAQITISTIGAVMSALRDVPKFDFGISASALAATYATIGAAQLAAVLATPIPKYEKGTKGKPHKGGPALVGEKRAEVIQEPGMNPYVIDTPTILNLKKGTEVTPSIDEWNRLQRASILASLDLELNKSKSYQPVNQSYDMQLLEAKIENGIEKGFRKARITINNNQSNVDLAHELWKLQNQKWG